MDVSQLTALLTPPVVFTLAAGLLLVLMRSPWPWTRAGGSSLAMVVLAAVALALRDPELRGRTLDAERLPILVLALSSAAMAWVAMRQATESSRQGALAWQGLSPARLLPGAAVVVAAALAAFLLGAPLSPVAEPDRPSSDLPAPWFMLGLRELLRYFDPWVPILLLPAATVLGLLALPHLDVVRPGGGKEEEEFEARRDVVYFFFFVWFLLALLPMSSAVFLRTDAAPTTPVALLRPFSELVWQPFGIPPRAAWLRELPAMFLLGLYFIVLPRQLPRWKPTRAILGRYVKRLGSRRFHLAMAYMQLWILVPIKMYAHWLLGIGYFLYLPELGFNF